MTQENNSALIVDTLCAGYNNRFVVHDISAQIVPPELVGIVGYNGSGKSTVILGITGLIDSRCKYLCIDGKDFTKKSTYKRTEAGLGILLQRAAVFPNLSIETNLQLSGKFPDIDHFKQYNSFYRLASEILERKSSPAGALSGGERRILGLLMSMSISPKYLMVDEPTLGLAEELEIEIFKILYDYAHSGPRGVLLVSHNINFVERECDRAYVIKEGRIVEDILCGTNRGELQKILSVSGRKEVSYG